MSYKNNLDKLKLELEQYELEIAECNSKLISTTRETQNEFTDVAKRLKYLSSKVKSITEFINDYYGKDL